ncbi:MAG: hypothetical protein KBC81_00515 [Candidatus Pacebacteria bacterium]|nr:hypothetical protein [Candidatus Paceibacterota bacterium]
MLSRFGKICERNARLAPFWKNLCDAAHELLLAQNRATFKKESGGLEEARKMFTRCQQALIRECQQASVVWPDLSATQFLKWIVKY